MSTVSSETGPSAIQLANITYPPKKTTTPDATSKIASIGLKIDNTAFNGKRLVSTFKVTLPSDTVTLPSDTNKEYYISVLSSKVENKIGDLDDEQRKALADETIELAIKMFTLIKSADEHNALESIEKIGVAAGGKLNSDDQARLKKLGLQFNKASFPFTGPFASAIDPMFEDSIKKGAIAAFNTMKKPFARFYAFISRNTRSLDISEKYKAKLKETQDELSEEMRNRIHSHASRTSNQPNALDDVNRLVNKSAEIVKKEKAKQRSK